MSIRQRVNDSFEHIKHVDEWREARQMFRNLTRSIAAAEKALGGRSANKRTARRNRSSSPNEGEGASPID